MGGVGLSNLPLASADSFVHPLEPIDEGSQRFIGRNILVLERVQELGGEAFL